MPPRAGTRSQASEKPRTSQPSRRKSQPQTSRAARRDEDDDDDDEDNGGDGDQDQDGDGMDVDGEQDASQGHDSETTRKANALVRLALFTEHKRGSLKRDEISKKVLGSNARSFPRVFERAQKILQKTFGMELVELRTRVELAKEGGATANAAVDEDEEGGAKKKAAASSKAYILRSTLDPQLIALANVSEEKILEEEAFDQPSDDDDEADDGDRAYAGSILSWSTSDQVGSLGILYTILALILVGGRVVPDNELRLHLKNLRLTPTTTINLTKYSTTRSVTLDTYLTQLLKQGYLDRLQVGGDAKQLKAKAKGKGGAKRVRGDEEDTDGTTYEWRWGPRAYSEVGEKAIAQFVAEFMVRDGLEGDDEEDGAGVNGRAGGSSQTEAKKKLDKMMLGIEKAAGGSLADVK